MIPAYNCSNYLVETLPSVLSQAPGPEQMQIEVVDDASTDADVGALVERIGRGRVGYYRQEQNVGSLRNFETCLKRSRGHLVHLLHGDDRVLPGFYEKHAELFRRHPEIGASTCRYHYIDRTGKLTMTQEPEMDTEGVLQDWLFRIAEVQRLQYVSVVVKRAVYEKVGSFYGLIYGEDWEMWVRIARDFSFAYTPEILAEYRGHAETITSRKMVDGGALRDLYATIQTIQNYLPEEKRKTVRERSKAFYVRFVLRAVFEIWKTTGNSRSLLKNIREAFRLQFSLSLLVLILGLFLINGGKRLVLALGGRGLVDRYRKKPARRQWTVTWESRWWNLELGELWTYRNLLLRLVRRDFLLSYQQTLLGPLWMLLQPLLTVLTFALVFHNLVGISTGRIPPVLFYLTGTVLWTFFNEIFAGVAGSFTANAALYSKVYFPRLVIPLSIVSTHFLRLLIQLGLVLAVLLYFRVVWGMPFQVSHELLLVPAVLAVIAFFALATGLLFSVITAKYRDLNNIVMVGLRMFMFVTPVIYPLAVVSESKRWVLEINPLTPLFEAFRFAVLGEGSFTPSQLVLSGLVAFGLLLAGVLLFNRQKEAIMDVI